MYKFLCLTLLAINLCHDADADRNSFEFHKFTNNKGKTLEARIFQDLGKEIRLQKKKGANIFTIKKDTLSGDSKKIIEDTIDRVRNDIKNNLTAESLYRGVALGLTNEIRAQLGKELRFEVKSFDIETNKESAMVALDGDIYLEVVVDPKDELFRKADGLWLRSKNKARFGAGRFWFCEHRFGVGVFGVDIGADRICQMKMPHKVFLDRNTSLEWGRPSVSEGVIIRN